jgi:hypothetical protein
MGSFAQRNAASTPWLSAVRADSFRETAERDGFMTPRSSSQSSRAPRNAAPWRRRAVTSSSAPPYNRDDRQGYIKPAIRSLQPCAILATLAGALVLLAIMGLSLDAVPELPAKIVLGVSLPLFYGAMLAAITPPSPPGPAARRPGPRPDDATRGDDDDLPQPSEPERLSARRRTRLTALGVPEDVALVFAEDPSFSVGELSRLRAQGCPLDTALRILWPA